MRIELFSVGSDDCPAILFYGCPSAGAQAVIKAFRSLAEGPETEVAFNQLPGVIAVAGLQLFAMNTEDNGGIRQLSATLFHWHRDREGWLEVAELAEPVANSEPSNKTKFQYLEQNGKVKVIFSTDRTW